MATLKEKNKIPLLTALVCQAVVFWAAFTASWGFDFDSWENVLKRFAQTSPLAAILGIAVFLLQGALGSDAKARLIFWRFTGNPYPGARAFSKWLYRDARIDPGVIKQKHNPLPHVPNKENALWYKLLKQHEAKPSIEDAHRRYLFARDLATNWLLFGLVACAAIWWGKSEIWLKILFDVGTLVMYVLMTWVARNHGVRLVTSVLAAESSN